MNHRVFRTSGGAELSFSELGFGAAPLGNMHRVLADNDAIETVQTAFDLGVRYFDTAPLYGHGLSERRIGSALASYDQVQYVISTKVGRLLVPCAPGSEESGIYRSVPPVRVRYDYSYEGVLRSLGDSLSRLGLDRVDIVFVHDVDAFTHGSSSASEARIREFMEGGYRALDRLRQNGVIRAIGAGVNEWQPCLRLLQMGEFDIFLLAGRYTLLEQESLAPIMNVCVQRNVALMIGAPFNSGILAQGPVAGAMYNYAPAPPDILERVRRIAAVCRRHGVTASRRRASSSRATVSTRAPCVSDPGGSLALGDAA